MYNYLDFKGLVDESVSMLEEFDYIPQEQALEYIFRRWQDAKEGLFELFRKHPNWDKDNFRISVPIEIERQKDPVKIDIFHHWCIVEFKRMFQEKYEIKRGFFTLGELEDLSFNAEIKAKEEFKRHGNTFKFQDLANDTIRFKTMIADIKRECGLYSHILGNDGKEICVRDKDIPRYHVTMSALTTSIKTEITVIDEDFITEFENCTYVNSNNLIKVRPKVGQKISRFVQQLCKEIGLTDIKNPVKEEWEADGVHHERWKDNGWNKQYAQYTDAVNVKKYKDTLYISINPIDYWTMSLGNGWSSCYCIDKENYRKLSCSYNGDYCAGTTSYMLDNVTFICYLKGDESEYGKYTKKKRQVFCWGKDKLYQGRLYPDGRDGGNAKAISKAFLKAVQEIIHPNAHWNSSNPDYYEWDGLGYDDFYHACETRMYYIGDELNESTVYISATPYAIDYYAGEITQNNHIDESGMGRVCASCGDPVVEDDCITARDGTVFCCERCAEYEGYYYCEDIEEFTDDFYETVDDGYYYYNDDLHYTDDGRYYASEWSLENDGYRFCEDTEEWSRDYFEDDYDGYYYSERLEKIEIGYYTYASEENAIADGWVKQDDGSWEREE